MFSALIVGDIGTFIGYLQSMQSDGTVIPLLKQVFYIITMEAKNFKKFTKGGTFNEAYESYMKNTYEFIVKPLFKYALSKLPEDKRSEFPYKLMNDGEIFLKLLELVQMLNFNHLPIERVEGTLKEVVDALEEGIDQGLKDQIQKLTFAILGIEDNGPQLGQMPIKKRVDTLLDVFTEIFLPDLKQQVDTIKKFFGIAVKLLCLP